MLDEGEEAQQPGCDGSAQPDEKWGDPISEERQAELRALFERQKEWVAQSEATRGESVFKGVKLTGADVYWLAEWSARYVLGTDSQTHRSEEVEEARLMAFILPELGASTLHLEEADLFRAHLEGAKLDGAHLKGVKLDEAHLEGANLEGAHLEEAVLLEAHLEGADISDTHLEGADLFRVHLEGADLSHATFNLQTHLNSIVLSDTPHWYSALAQRMRQKRVYGPVSLGNIRWNDVDLTSVDWSVLKRLGDERSVRWWGRHRGESDRATRANTQLAKRLRDAGLNDDADRFAYRAQVCQRGVHLLRLRLGRWLFSWLLFVVAGYGYRPLRTLFWYLATIASFAFAYYWTTRGVITLGAHPSEFQPLAWYEALVLSVSSFHGRGFLPFPNLGDPVTILAAIEAVFGLFIEVSFIATFTNRYLGK